MRLKSKEFTIEMTQADRSLDPKVSGW